MCITDANGAAISEAYRITAHRHTHVSKILCKRAKCCTAAVKKQSEVRASREVFIQFVRESNYYFFILESSHIECAHKKKRKNERMYVAHSLTPNTSVGQAIDERLSIGVASRSFVEK